ncbi:hypothetical protein ACFY3U_01740 [Micromonospora sp. NPDC000089]|uniref:hypothetical protein n=1 Tax=unclassified Micromonospora TaxID=2617518 RepID=UPI0036CEF64C
MPRTIRHPLIFLLASVLTAGGLVALGNPHLAHADDGCGTGTNSSVKTREAQRHAFGRRVITIPAAYDVSADTCNAAATATGIREEVNRISNGQKKVETVAIIGTLIGWLIGPEGAAAVGGAGFILTSDIESAKVRLNSVANSIQEANQRCGNRGITYSAGIDSAGRTLYASNFVCQGSNNKDLDPDISDIAPPTSDIVPGPEPDGGTPCSADPDNLYFSHDDGLDQYWMDTFESASGSDLTFRHYQWNESTGDYDLDQGTFTKQCGPVPNDDGGQACSSNPSDVYYSHSGSTYWKDVFAGTDGAGNNTYERYQWSPTAKSYETDLGPFTVDCGPPDSPHDPTLPPEVPNGSDCYKYGEETVTQMVIDWCQGTGGGKLVLRITNLYNHSYCWSYDYYSWGPGASSWTLTYPAGERCILTSRSSPNG